MFLRCLCGYTLTDVATPGRIAHSLLSAHAVERLQDAVDSEVRDHGAIECWPEHWETARAVDTWLCPQCSRLYVGVGGVGPVRIFALERIGLSPEATGLDSEFGTLSAVLELAREQAGESPVSAQPAAPETVIET